MRLPLSVFTLFSLLLALLYITAYGIFIDYFKNDRLYQAQLQRLEEQVSKEKNKSDWLSYQLKDIQLSVAQVLPANKKLQSQYQLKNLVSSFRVPASVDKVDLSGIYFGRGKTYFAQGKLEDAIREFNRLNHQFPLSQFRVESYLLTAESYFLSKNYKQSLSIIDEMVTQFPDNDLTGFALLRMGQISEMSSRLDEASEIYNTVMTHFKNPIIQKQAQLLKKNVDSK